MAENNKVNVTINFKAGDLSGLPAVDSFTEALEEARKEIEQSKSSGSLRGLAAGSQELDVAGRRLNVIAGEAMNVRKALIEARLEMGKAVAGTAEFDEAVANVARLEAAFDNLSAAARNVPSAIESTARQQQIESARRPFEAAGQASSGFSAIAGATSVISPELAGLLTAGSDLTGGLEFLKQLPDALGELGESARRLPGLAGAAAEAGAGLANVFPGMTAGMGAFLGVALPLVAVGAALAAGFALVTNAANAAGEAARRQAAANTEAAARSNEIARLVAAGDTNAIQERLTAAQQAFEDASDAFATTAAQADEASRQQQEAAARALTDISAIGEIFTTGSTISNYNQELEANRTAMEAAQAELEAYTASLAAAEEQARRNAAVQGEVDALDRQYQIQQEINAIVESGSREQLAARQRQIEQEIALINSVLPGYQSLAATNEEAAATAAAYEERLLYLTELGGELSDGTAQLIEARQAETEAVQEQLEAIQSRIQQEIQFAELQRSATVEQVERRQQAIADEIAAIESVLGELQTLAATSEEAAAQLDQANSRLADLREESARLSSDIAPEARRRQIEEGQAALLEAEQNSLDRQREIREESYRQLIALEQKRVDAIKKATDDAAKAFGELDKKINKAVGDENKRYMQDELKALENFQQAEQKAQTDYNKQRLRVLQDLHSSLLEAEEDNDVVAFIRAKRAGEQQLQNMQVDADDATRIRTEQFLAERKAAQQAHEEKLAQIKLQAEEERAAIAARRDESIKAAQADYEAQRKAVQDNTRQRIDAEKDALRQAQDAIRQKFNLEREAGVSTANTIKSAFMSAAAAVKAALDSAMAGAGGKGGGKGGWDTSIGDTGKPPVGGKPGAGGGKGGSSNNSGFSSGGNGWGGGGGSSNNKGGLSQGNGWGFLEGGIVAPGKQVVGLFEQNRSYSEAVMPLEPMRLRRAFAGVFDDMRGAGGGGLTFQWNGDVTVAGEGVTVAEVQAVMEKTAYTIVEAIHEARLGIENG